MQGRPRLNLPGGNENLPLKGKSDVRYPVKGKYYVPALRQRVIQADCQAREVSVNRLKIVGKPYPQRFENAGPHPQVQLRLCAGFRYACW